MSETKHLVRKRAVEPERQHFKSLLIANPNYFGTLKNSDFKAVKAIANNASYEELKCVGLYPEFDTLEAIVYINQDSGYGGDICDDGTPEYVRFYLSYDNGATWEDQGVTSFQAQDIPGHKPLEYAVQLKIAPKKRFCQIENLPKVRAILSWNVLPPANTPNFVPVWGNVLDSRVQIDVLQWILKYPVDLLVKDAALLAVLKDNHLVAPDITLAEFDKLDLAEVKDELAKTLTKTVKPLSALELHHNYKNQKVEPKRYLYPNLHQLSKSTTALKLNTTSLKTSGVFAGLDIDLSKVIDQIINTDGNTSYEELHCVGLNTTTDNLEAVLKVKLPYGFLGGLCKTGSRQYVAFWMDFGSGAGWEYMGTTSVKTHDLASLPPEGVDYAVLLPVNLADRRQPCHKGPKTARVRAILSWETPPPPGNPNWIPTWGNREETLVLITPGQTVQPDTHPAMIETVGGMAVPKINGVTGLANGTAETAGFTAVDSPFGYEIVVTGHLAYPTNISAGAAALEYQVQVSNNGGATWQPLSNSFGISRTQLLNGIWSWLPGLTQAAPSGWYTYREDLTGGPGDAQIFVAGNVLARWQTNATMNGLWRMRILSRVSGTLAPVWTSSSVTIQVDCTAPAVAFDITSGGGACADFGSGTLISGTYSVSDDHFGSYQFSLVPNKGGTFSVDPSPVGPPIFSGAAGSGSLSRGYPTVSTTGESGGWELDTTGVPQCGYVIYLHAWDRTIVNSGSVGLHNSAVVGICIRE